MRHLLICFLATLSFSSLEAQAAKSPSKPLFSSGAETFFLKDKNGKTPSFVVLNDSATERALAAVAIAAINADPKVQPKIPSGGDLNLRVESLELAPSVEGPNNLVVSIKLSGRDVELNRPLDKAKFLSGQTVTIDFPESSKNLALFTVDSSGRLKMRLDKATNNIIIEEARAKSYYQSMAGAEGTENISFSGKGLRQPK